MRITGVNFKLRSESHCTSSSTDSSTGSSSSTNRRCTYTTYYDADFDLNWGYQWACPDDNNRVCDSKLTFCSVKVCNSQSCSFDATDEAFSRVYECAARRYDPTMVDSYYTEFDPLVGPSQDENWPSVIAYGDCGQCSSLLTVPSLQVSRIVKIIGGVFLLVAALLLLGILLWRVVRCYRYVPRTQNKEHETKQEQPQERATAKSSIVELIDEETLHDIPLGGDDDNDDTLSSSPSTTY